MEKGLHIKIKYAPRGAWIWTSVCSLLCYISLWGVLCSMAGLGRSGALPLIFGGAVAAILPALPKRREILLFAAVFLVIFSLFVFLIRFSATFDGAKIFINRLYSMSEASQSYIYDKLQVSASDENYLSCTRLALFSCGIVSGVFIAAPLSYGKSWHIALILVAVMLLEGYLGVSPRVYLNGLLALSLALSLIGAHRNTGSIIFIAAAFALICAISLLLPDSYSVLSAWSESARDTLAGTTLAYSEARDETAVAEETSTTDNKEFYQEEGSVGDLEGDKPLSLPIKVIFAIIAFALILFIPAIISDTNDKRRKKNRAGIESTDNALSVRAMFLYTMRWFELGGVAAENVPYSGLLGKVQERFSPEVRKEFESVLPIWQEAAYSTHEIDSVKREKMRSFMEQSRSQIWDKLSKKQRILSKYFYAL
jgi:hypothetical protein